MSDLIERLRVSVPSVQCGPGHSSFGKATQAHRNPDGPEAADEIERLRDKVDGLNADLRCAVQTAYNRGATEWARLNYRDMIPWLESQTSQSPTDRKEA